MLFGHANGPHKEAYWTNSEGYYITLTQNGEQTFMCAVGQVGQFTVTLTEVSSSGEQAQATHNVTCIP